MTALLFRRRWLLLCLCLILVARSGYSQQKEEDGIGLSLFLNKVEYARGEPISMSLRLSNRTQETLTLSFPDAQRFDFLIRDRQDREVWQWSKNRLFAQVLGQEILRPGHSLVYAATFSDDLTPGRYTVVGKIVATDHPLSATTTVIIK